MKNKLIVMVLSILITTSALAQRHAFWNKHELILNNGLVERKIKLPDPDGTFLTTSYKPVHGTFRYMDTICSDFSFVVNDKSYSGKDRWTLKSITPCSDKNNGHGALVSMLSQDNKIELGLEYLLYKGSPCIRKRLIINNISTEILKLESVDVEKLETSLYYSTTFSVICHDYGRRRSIGPYDGDMQDALLIVHNSDWQEGIVVGNEAAGVIKQTSVFQGEQAISSGLTHANARFPFRKYLKPQETFATPQVFTMVYNNHKDPDEILNTAVPEFVEKYMGTRLSALKVKPTFVYNTWEPFEKNINEKLVMELAKSAAAAGMKEFVIDDGWSTNYGDWVIDSLKFPHGLKPVFDYIKSLGMKPGLWVSIGSASNKSKVFQEHPEWFVKDAAGNFTSLHVPGDAERYTACFSTGWYDYIKKILLKLSVDFGLEYMKLDFAVVTSPYQFDYQVSGCYAKDHQAHYDHNESLNVNYEKVWSLFDELHENKPNLFIDCTFETMGGLQLIDYATLKHAEGSWLSNFQGVTENIDLRIRNMAWWRSPAMPATALVIGNPEMQDARWLEHLNSLAGALPIMLGDPRKLTKENLKLYRTFSDWMGKMERRYQILTYRQDLPGLGEPKEGMWDGFQRINTEAKNGGIIGVFRHGSLRSNQYITIRYLDPKKMYEIKRMNGNVLDTQTGLELEKKGFKVTVQKMYAGELFEVSEKRKK